MAPPKMPKISEIPMFDNYPDYEEWKEAIFLIASLYDLPTIETNSSPIRTIYFKMMTYSITVKRKGYYMRAEGDPRKLLNILDEVYGEPIQVQQVKYTRELATFCWNEGKNVEKYITRFTNIREKLTSIQQPPNDSQLFAALFDGLPKNMKDKLPHVNPTDTPLTKLQQILRELERQEISEKKSEEGQSLYNQGNEYKPYWNNGRGRGDDKGGRNGRGRGGGRGGRNFKRQRQQEVQCAYCKHPSHTVPQCYHRENDRQKGIFTKHLDDPYQLAQLRERKQHERDTGQQFPTWTTKQQQVFLTGGEDEEVEEVGTLEQELIEDDPFALGQLHLHQGVKEGKEEEEEVAEEEEGTGYVTTTNMPKTSSDVPIIDNGATNHLWNDKSSLINLILCTKTFRTGNQDSPIKATAVGEIYLKP